MGLLEDNLKRIEELEERVRWAGIAACTECHNINRHFRIPWAFRTTEQQHTLWQRGRNAIGKVVDASQVVTNCDGYKILSVHQKRLAIDIFPINCSYADVAEVFKAYGVTHPYTTGDFVDLPHLEFGQVRPRVPENINPLVRLKGLKRRLAFEKDMAKAKDLAHDIAALERRLGIK
jgi:hypothetical protein